MSGPVLITGTLRNRQGEVVAGTRVLFRPEAGVVGQNGATVLPIKAETVSDEAGAISVARAMVEFG